MYILYLLHPSGMFLRFYEIKVACQKLCTCLVVASGPKNRHVVCALHNSIRQPIFASECAVGAATADTARTLLAEQLFSCVLYESGGANAF